MKVFGIGWSKTGTTSLGAALERLGILPHVGYDVDLVLDVRDGNLDRILALSDRCNAFEDWPWPLLYKEMDERHPDAKFVLTVRDWDKRFKSYCKHIERAPPQSEKVSQGRELYFGFHDAENHEDEVHERWDNHLADVKEYFSGRPGKLLIVDWEAGDGWEKLCEFLGVPVPDELFPHKNKDDELRQ